MFRIILIFLLYSVYFGTDGFTIRQKNEFFELSIVHINDFHARFAQTSVTSNSCRKGKENECIGGLGRVMTITKQLLNEQKNPIFLNAGDNYQGTMWYNIFKWNATVRFMNMLPHDAMTIGNHDFDDDVPGVIPFLQRFNAPVLLANIDDSEEPIMKDLYQKSTIIIRDNQKIGVIGVITTKTTIMSKPGKVKFLDEVESINAEAELLKVKGVNIIIVLSHVGLDVDQVIAENCPDVDVIVGGHSHTFLYSGLEPPPIEHPIDEYPVIVKQNSTKRTVLIVQAGAYTKYLGNLTVWFDTKGEVADWDGNPIFLANYIEEDPEVMEELKPWAEVVNAITERVVGETQNYLNGSCYNGECTMGNLITDAMIHTYESKANNSESWTYAAISCTNAGGVRSHIPAGEITYGDLATVLPFENTIDVVELKGNDLYSILENSVAPDGHLLHWSGIRVLYNMSMPAWSRVQSLSIRCQACKVPKYELLNHDKWYRVIVSSHLADGGHPLITEKHRNRQVGPLDIISLEEYIKSISPFNYELDHRIQIVS